MQPIATKRMCILGNSGSGKSTLADALGKLFNVPVYHLDRELLHGQFVSLGLQEQRRIHNEIISKEEWIIDGRYSKLLPDRLSRATMVIIIDTPRSQAIFQLFRRHFKKDQLRSSIPLRAKSGIGLRLLSYTIRYKRRKRLEELKKLLIDNPKVTLVVLKPDTLESWIEQISQFFLLPQ